MQDDSKLTAVDDDGDDHDILDDFGVPESWPDDARDAFRTVLEQLPDIEGPAFVSLDLACGLIAQAVALEEIARAANYEAVGSTGQTVIHWAVPEARQARTTAAQIMRQLTPVPKGNAPMTNSERSRRASAARWGGR